MMYTPEWQLEFCMQTIVSDVHTCDHVHSMCTRIGFWKHPRETNIKFAIDVVNAAVKRGVGQRWLEELGRMLCDCSGFINANAVAV